MIYYVSQKNDASVNSDFMDNPRSKNPKIGPFEVIDKKLVLV